MENENTNENKKKQKVAILIGVVTLLIAVLGATYAYFQISTDTESSNTNITGKTPPKSLATLKQGTDNLHLNISASDMSYENRTKEYYGTDGEDPYVGTEDLGTKTIATVELTGGEETTKYSCTAKLTVSKVIEPDAEKDTMIDALQPGDMILQFKGNIISEKLDLSELKENNPKEYNLNFKITGNKVENIQAYIKLVNKNEPQNYLAGKKLNIDISTSELKCNIAEPETIDKLRNNDNQKYLSSDLQGGMYRYQAAFEDSDSSEMTNWICFGTKSKDECTNEETGIDKYMYRIIGITEEGELYLLKETFVKEGETLKFKWNTKGLLSDCLGEACEWPNVDLYKRLNGEASNGNPIFINNSEYEYMAQGTEWYNLIEDHNWMYGDTEQTTSNSSTYNGNRMYRIETGESPTTFHWPDELTQTSCIPQCNMKSYKWTKSVQSKVGLMYMHDYNYAYPGGSSGSGIKSVNSWIHFTRDGYNLSASFSWLITREGAGCSTCHYSHPANIKSTGGLAAQQADTPAGVVPVFYLKSKAKIAGGDGTKGNPYILE